MKRLLLIGALAAALALAYPAWLGWQIWEQARHDEARPADAIVVLGAAQYDGDPSPIFKARLDHAAYLYSEGFSKTIIVTGGRRPGDRFSEAEAGTTYLAGEALVPEEDILQEDEGTTSLESLQAVSDLATEQDIETVLLVSDPLHSERIKRMARDLGFDEAYVSWASYAHLERSRATKVKQWLHEIGSLITYELLGR